MKTNIISANILFLGLALLLVACGGSGNKGGNGALSSSIAEKVYVAPGERDEQYAFLSGGYSVMKNPLKSYTRLYMSLHRAIYGYTGLFKGLCKAI